MTKVFFATACHSNSNQCFNMRDRPISTNKKRLQNFACIKLQCPCLATPLSVNVVNVKWTKTSKKIDTLWSIDSREN